jgi:hypothetical protein
MRSTEGAGENSRDHQPAGIAEERTSTNGCGKHYVDQPERLAYVIGSEPQIRTRSGGCICHLRPRTQSCDGSRGTGSTEERSYCVKRTLGKLYMGT